MARIEVECDEQNDGWNCSVTVREEGSTSSHTVRLPEEDYRNLTGDGADPETLVRESFRFLLEREPVESILSNFDIMTIARYFPDYPERISKRL